MDEKTKELIAIGASIGAHCQPCLEFHVAKARELGIEDGMIREAIAVGHMVEKGSMIAMRQFADGILDVSASKTSGCCGADKAKSLGCCG